VPSRAPRTHVRRFVLLRRSLRFITTRHSQNPTNSASPNHLTLENRHHTTPNRLTIKHRHRAPIPIVSSSNVAQSSLPIEHLRTDDRSASHRHIGGAAQSGFNRGAELVIAAVLQAPTRTLLPRRLI